MSVIVPVRDRRELLSACLAAIVPQLASSGELIVVDDGSTDGSRHVAERWEESGAPVRVLDGGGRGAVAARATGVAAARGAVLAFTDSDCVPDPGWLAAGLKAVGSGADLVVGRTVPARACGLHERSVWVTFDDGLYATCNLFVRHGTFDAAGGFDAGAGERLGFRHGAALRGLGFGEDTMFGWQVRRSGGCRCFAEDAVVRHHVFPFEAPEHLRRSWQAGGFPGLVRDVPELRDVFLDRRVFLGSARRVPLYLASLAVVGRRPRAAALCLAAWAGGHAQRVCRLERSWSRRGKVLAVVLSGDAVTGAALVAASVRKGTVVL